MKIHYLMHVPFEGPQAISSWAREKGHDESYTKLFEGETLPSVHDIDLLVIMGGPMGVHDEAEYPWLKDEKAFIGKVIDSGKPAFGVCLGAQLLADALGANVHKNLYKEIGFFPVSLTPLGWDSPIFGRMPATFNALHWHGDTFEIPKGALHIASSSGCANQAFVFDNRLVGFQFHIECTRQGLENLIKNCGNELLEEGEYIQRPEVLLEEGHDFDSMNQTLYTFLDDYTGYLKSQGVISG
ncbi:MAG: type 1 glutamine amidotransferase [Thermodesulfobacteria bacterium]|nr:type 1 glutamine amidotransferase [Thermodesulfobacteriota bacterium]